MRNINVTNQDILELDLDAYAYFLEHDFDFSKLSKLSEQIYGPLEATIKNRGFSGKAESVLVLNGVYHNKPVYIILLGLGDLDRKSLNVETYRRAVGRLVRVAQSHKLNSIGFALPDPVLIDLSYKKLAEETSTILHKSAYHFDKFITNPDRKLKWDFDLFVSVNENNQIEVEDGINQGIVIGHAINKSRYWCDMPPSQFTPTIFASKAQEIAKEYNLSYKIFNEEEIIQMGMGGLAGVSRGSVEDCRLAILEYKYEPEYAPTIAIVGKGITFDSGGLSLKPANAMETMKDDMAGAAIVLSVMEVIAQLKPKINVVALAPMSENMPSGSALKPGDIVKFYNGKTAEVLNTDAEGRLILADALSYAVANYKLDAIVDLATLTGACAYFLGPFYAGLLSPNDDLSKKLKESSRRSGDRLWRLPMDEDYHQAIISDIADISNTGNAKYKSGAITAAFFLKNFVNDVPWAHIDTAGVSFGVPGMSYLRDGATGFGVRLLTDLIMNWNA